MSDDLIISGGGSTAVEVDTLFVDATRLGVAEVNVQGWNDRFEAIRARLAALEGPGLAGVLASGSIEPALVYASTVLVQAQEKVESLRPRVLQSAERYGATERFIAALWDLGGRLGAVALGTATPALAFLTVGWAANALVVGAALAAPLTPLAVLGLFGKGPLADARPEALLEQWLAEHREILSDPMFVRLVRTVADHADDYAFAAIGAAGAGPLGAVLNAPDSASAVLGLTALASKLGLGSGRLLTDGPVKVERVAPERNPTDAAPPTGRFPVPAPTGLADLAQRVPPSDGKAQITVERYDVDGEQRWIVYVGGTVDFTLEAGREPSDMTSNLHSVAQSSILDDLRSLGAESGAADRAVRAALAEAGASPDDPVLAIGHSGGGVIAAGLASDPDLNVVAAVSLGGPVAAAPVREGVPFLSVEHAEDFVPATGGSGGPGGRSSDMLIVEREALEPGFESNDLVPAHSLTRYRETAELFDRAEEERLVAFRTTVTDFTGGTTGERTRWRASRE